MCAKNQEKMRIFNCVFGAEGFVWAGQIFGVFRRGRRDDAETPVTFKCRPFLVPPRAAQSWATFQVFEQKKGDKKSQKVTKSDELQRNFWGTSHCLSALIFFLNRPKWWALRSCSFYANSLGGSFGGFLGLFWGAPKKIVKKWKKCEFSIAFLGQKDLSEQAKYLEFCEEDVETILKHPWLLTVGHF